MKRWYELNIDDRYEIIYKKHSLQDFMEWWSDGSDSYMELRFDNYKCASECGRGFNIPYEKQSVFIKNSSQLEKVLKVARNKSTIWFGINPRRPMHKEYGNVGFGGADIFIAESKFLFIDIDRIESNKNGPATHEDLMNADFLAEQLIEELGKGGFNKNFIKICSGNGVQMLIKLDIPIHIPVPQFTVVDGIVKYIQDSLFIEAKQIIQKGIGKILPAFSNRFKENYKVEIDSTGFNVGRVGALPYSYNRKNKIPVIRGIIEIHKEGVNEGLSDYLKSLYDNSQTRKIVSQTIRNKPLNILSNEYRILSNNMNKNVIVGLMLKHVFPNGGINNTLWYGIKILLHNNGICMNDSEYIKIHEMLKNIHNRSFTENGLEEQYQNNYNGSIGENDIEIVPAMINKYLRLNKIKSIETGREGVHAPIFPISPRGKVPFDIKVDINPALIKKHTNENYKLNSFKQDPLKDIIELLDELFKIRRGDKLKDFLKEGDFAYTPMGAIFVRRDLEYIIISFIKNFRIKWGDNITIYMMKYYMDDYINCRRW